MTLKTICWFSYGAGADGYTSGQQRMSYAYVGDHVKCVFGDGSSYDRELGYILWVR